MKVKKPKSKISQVLHPTRFVSKRKDGTLRIVRDSYSNVKQSWWDVTARILKRDGYRCRATLVNAAGVKTRCPNSQASGHTLEVHHIKELSKGGKTIDANLITLCMRCHDRRHKHLNRTH